jgi:hypothetical protein
MEIKSKACEENESTKQNYKSEEFFSFMNETENDSEVPLLFISGA